MARAVTVKGRLGGRPISKGAAVALQTLREGNCEPARQQAFVGWLVDKLCNVHGEAFDANERITAYALGRRSVGLDLLDHLTVNIGALSEDKETKGNG